MSISDEQLREIGHELLDLINRLNVDCLSLGRKAYELIQPLVLEEALSDPTYEESEHACTIKDHAMNHSSPAINAMQSGLREFCVCRLAALTRKSDPAVEAVMNLVDGGGRFLPSVTCEQIVAAVRAADGEGAPMNHPNLSDGINSNIAQSEIEGGVWVHDHPDCVNDEIKAQPVLAVGAVLEIQTKNTLYLLEKRGPNEFYISGNTKYCSTPTKCSIHGSTWGGSMLKMGFVGRGMNLEFSTSYHNYPITTTTIQEVREVLAK